MASKKNPPPPKTPATPLELKVIKALGRCTFQFASWTKRFVRDLQGATALTEKQREWLHKVFYRYRRQLGLTDEKAKRLVCKMQGVAVYEQEGLV